MEKTVPKPCFKSLYLWKILWDTEDTDIEEWRHRVTHATREQVEVDIVSQEDSIVSQDSIGGSSPQVTVQEVDTGSAELGAHHEYSLRSTVAGQGEPVTCQEKFLTKMGLLTMTCTVYWLIQHCHCGAQWAIAHPPTKTLASEEKRGLACQVSLKCSSCSYKTQTQKLYAEVDTGKLGPKPAEINIGLAVTTQNTSIGPIKVLTQDGASVWDGDSVIPEVDVLWNRSNLLDESLGHAFPDS